MPSGSQPRVITDQIADYPADLLDLDQRCEWRFFDEEDLNVQLRNARTWRVYQEDNALSRAQAQAGSAGSASDSGRRLPVFHNDFGCETNSAHV
jgi:hypothetical protein